MLDSLSYKEWLGLLAIALGLCSYIPYIISIHKGKTKPHAFSWFIWGVLMLIGYAAQVYDGGGAGAWITGISGLISLYVAALAWKVRNHNTITKSDWVTLALTLSAIPLWLVTDNPLWSVILISAIDASGFYPTFRKAYRLPDEEYTPSYNIGTAKHLVSIWALENYSFITTFYPAVLAGMNVLFVLWVYWRRSLLGKELKGKPR